MARSKGMGGGPSMAFEKPRAGAKAILRRLWRYLYHYKWLLAAAVALSLTGNLLALAGPKLSGYAIDAIRPGPGRVDFNTVFHYAKRMLVFYFAAAALSYVLAALMVRLSRNVVYRMRKDIYDHLMRLPVRFFDTHAIGDVLSVLSYDVDTINASLSNDLVQMLTSVITVAGSFGMMLSSADPYFRCDHSHFRDVYTTPFQTGAAAVPPPLCRSGRFERLCRGNDGRAENHQGLWPGGGVSFPF